MGVCFYVMCDCWKKGKTKKMYFDKYIVQTHFDLELKLPENILKDKEKAAKIEKDFIEWEKTACEHEFMWKSFIKMKTLPYILDELGGRNEFPTLYYTFNDNHTDFIPIEMNKDIIRELDKLIKKEETKKHENCYYNYLDFMEALNISEETGNPLCFC